jgi:hypothetical protein
LEATVLFRIFASTKTKSDMILTHREIFLLVICAVIYITLFVVTIQYHRRKIQLLQSRLDNIHAMQKMAVIEEYVAQLSDEIVEKYRNDLDNYTCDELDMHLAYELKKANPNVYTKSSSDFVPKQIPEEGIAAVLSKYKK